MRISKKLLVFLFVASIFNSCKDDDNTSFVVQDISAPTNISAVFDISQDDSGMVTVTPSAVGASSFDVFFGDVESETATAVSPGETVSKVYGEGEFNLRIVAIGATGLTSELVRVVTISFTPPTDLMATIAVSETNPFEVNVTPVAENATVFDVFFGLGAEEVPITIMSGETATYMYAEAGDYEIRIVARGAGSATIESSETVTVTGNAAPIVLPITFDDATVNYAFSTFNGSTYEVVDNPDVSGANAEESKVGAITNSGVQFEGGAFILGTPVDFSGANKTVSMKFWATSALPVLLKFEGGVNDERQTEVVAQHGGTGWEVLTFDFATDAIKSFIDGSQGVGEAFVPDGQYATLVLFVDGPGTTAGTFYLDDVAQTSGETSPLALPISFDDAAVNYDFGVFNGASYEVVDNPDASGTNSTVSKVGAITNSGGQFEGGAFTLDNAVDFSADKTITMKFWSTISLPILLKFEGGVNGERENEVVATHGGAGWEELTFDFASNATKSFIDGSQGVGEAFVPEGQYGTLVLFVDGPGTTAGTFYIDDITQTISSGGETSGKTTFPVDFESGSAGAASQWNIFENVDNPTLGIIVNPDATGANTSSTVAEFTARLGGQTFAGAETPLETPFTLDASNSTVKIMVWKSVISDVAVKFSNASGGSTGDIKVPNTLTNQWEELTFDFSGVIGDPNNTNIEFLVIFPDFDARTQDNVVYFDNVTLSASGGGSSIASAPTTAAPTPTEMEANVIAMFSNAYAADVSVSSWRSDWSTGVLTDIQVEGNDTKQYEDADFVGVEFYGTPVDASSMGFFHVDVWSAEQTTFSLKLVDLGAGSVEGNVERTIATGEWVSLDIPMADFIAAGLSAQTSIQQLLFDGTSGVADSFDFYIDNVYFYN